MTANGHGQFHVTFSLTKSLCKIEADHGIRERWQVQDALYRTVLDELRLIEICPVLQTLFKAVVEWKQLYELLHKFCGKSISCSVKLREFNCHFVSAGQAAYSRIDSLVKGRVKTARSQVNKYNMLPKPSQPSFPDVISLESIRDPEGQFWVEVQLKMAWIDVDPSIPLKLLTIHQKIFCRVP